MSSPDRAKQVAPEVLIIGLNYAPETTGIAPYTTALARNLAAESFGVTAVTGYPHYPAWELHEDYKTPRKLELDHGVRLERVAHPVPRNPHGVGRILMEIVFAARAGLRLARRRPTVVVCISPALLSLIPALLLRPFRRHRVGVIIQDLYGAALAETGLSHGLLTRATAWLESFLLQRVDGITVIHDVFRRRLIDAGFASDKIEVIPNWAHVTMSTGTDRDRTRRTLGWSDDEFIALHAGNMGAKQGLEGLVDVAKLAEERASAIRVVLLGNGSRRSALMEYGEGLDRITFIDSLPQGEFEDALMAADLLVLHEKPGVVEMSVPSKLTTYFTTGRPVVAATDPRSGAAALMSLSRAGITVRAGEAKTLLDAIEGLASDPTSAARLGSNGQYYAAEHLTSARSLSLLRDWIRRLHDPQRRYAADCEQGEGATTTVAVGGPPSRTHKLSTPTEGTNERRP